MVKYHGVLKQGSHGKIPQCFETCKSWYTTVYHVIPWYIFYKGDPCSTPLKTHFQFEIAQSTIILSLSNFSIQFHKNVGRIKL